MIYVIDPCFSAVPPAEAEQFLAAALPTLSTLPVSILQTPEQVLGTDPDPGDGVAFFNPLDSGSGADVEDLLVRAAGSGAVILPIALRKEWRRPPEATGEFQSFDVVEQRRARGLGEDQVETVANGFARQALGRLQPTYSRDRMGLFLCHRREDSEGLTAAVGERLDALHEGLVFRDLIDVQTGERSQERIDEALAGADALVFLDTPKAHESWWIAHELSQAMGRNIPIVWVRIGGDHGRQPLPIRPAAAPHISTAETELEASELQALADRIRETAFELSLEQVRVGIAALRKLQSWAAENDAELQTLDARRLIFELRRNPNARGYPTRPAIDVVQMFARHPTEKDREHLERFLHETGLGPHERDCRSFDAALMLDPTATGVRQVGDWSVVEHPGRFLQTLDAPRPPADGAGHPTLLLLGAFPKEPGSRQEVTQAIHAFTTTWLRLGGAIVFGGHPTFTPLVVESARLVVPGSERDRVTIYQSRWFASPAALQELEALVSVRAIEATDDHDSSLSVMRAQMCGIGAGAAIAIGGRADESGTHRPGIDEEIRLARAAGSPAFLLGGPGGRAAELAVAARDEEPAFAALGNPLSAQANEHLLLTDDYEDAARLIYRAITAGP